MQKREYKFTLTEENKSKVEQFLKLLNIDADIVEAENTKEVQEKEWPQDDCVYYFIDSDGEIKDDWFYLEDAPCKNRLLIGNCFKTRKEAEFELERLKVLAEMKKFAEPENRDWDGINQHWSIYIDTTDKSIYYVNYTHQKSNYIYFETYQKADECVNTIGEHRIKKYYLRIKE